MIIKNRDRLLANGNRAGREVVLDVLEAGLAAPDPYLNVRKILRREGQRLTIDGGQYTNPKGQPPLVFDLDEVGDIWVVGGGKAAQRAAEAVEEVLGDRISGGHINAKKGDSVRLKRIEVTLAGHPLPDEDSVEGGRRIIEIERQVKKGDIVFLCQSGGATALTAVPVPGVSLEDLQEVYRVLYFGCGANMPAANAVRNHLALVNGKHARYVGQATLISLHTEENPPDLRVHLFPNYFAGAADDVDAYQTAIDVINHYGCWDRMPRSVQAFLERRDPQFGPIRFSEIKGKPHYHFRVMGPEYMLEAAQRRAEALGISAHILISSLSDVEAQPVAETIAFLAQEIEALGRPFSPPCILICGGELVVTVGSAPGRGGRNQEFCLSAARRIEGMQNTVIASCDSDGADGATPVAGAIVDGQTAGRATTLGFDLGRELAVHNAHPVLTALGDTIETGIRTTNVRDLRVIYVGGQA